MADKRRVLRQVEESGLLEVKAVLLCKFSVPALAAHRVLWPSFQVLSEWSTLGVPCLLWDLKVFYRVHKSLLYESS